MINADTRLHVRGESQYVDDQPVPEDTLFAAVCPSPVAHGEIRGLDVSAAASRPGVEAVIRPADIPGENQIGNIIQDEPLLADGEVRYLGQPLAIVVARSADLARAAAQTIKPEIVERPAVFDPREAHRKGDLITPARTFVLGDVHGAWSACRWVVEGRADSGGQEHAYLESQGAVAVPAEGGRVKLISATQSPSVVQRIVARVLGVPMQAVEVDVLRLGGAFGGKEDQATAWAAVAAVAARVTGKPVKIVLRRREDILMTGKRHPYSSDFRIGLSADLKILAYEVMFYQDAGAAADLSPSILERTLFHATNSYCVPNVKATAASCRTHRAPNTAFRGFGAPQAMYAMECAIFKAAEVIGVAPEEIQRRNLLQEGDVFPYGMRCETTSVARSWERIERQPEVVTAARRVEAFNREHIWEKKGLARMPVCFGISFTSTPLNQAGALVHVYSDGSVGISTAAVEMGQGVNTKIRQVAAQAFGISVERVRMESTNTTRVANMPPTAASAAADMNGEAALRACAAILDRLKDVACGQLGGAAAEDIRMGETVFVRDEATPLTWEEVIRAAHRSRVDLSAHAHYATPGLSFDKTTEKGRPFSYHVAGTAAVEVTLDCLRGRYRVDNVWVAHDLGRSVNPQIDLGQMEGGVVQGIGWVTLEELLYDPSGRLLTDSLSTYKVPDLHFAPDGIAVQFMEDAEREGGLLGGKAIGEPPFMYGIGAYFALVRAMKAFRPELKSDGVAPLTPERVLMALHGTK